MKPKIAIDEKILLVMFVLWVIDEWHTLDHSKDTTLRLIEECKLQGIPCLIAEPDYINQSHFGEIACREILEIKTNVVSRSADSFILSSISLVSTSKICQIHYRIDPPVDDRYLNTLSKLEAICGTVPILNPPDQLKNQSEKVPPVELARFSPKSFVIHQASDIQNAWQALQNKAIVLKPMNTAQSQGVELIQDWNTFSIIERKTENFTVPILIQEYLDAIKNGEKRLWFVGDYLVGTLTKYPIAGDFRVLIDQGSKISKAILNDHEIQIAADIGKSLKQHGIRLAAIDIIDEKIIDYNITSPGLLVQLEQIHQQNLAKIILEQLGLLVQDCE
jgi:glutathione synthase